MSTFVAISLVTYNGEKWIERCLEAIKEQSHKDWRVFVVDNNSQDGSIGLVKKIMPEADLIVNQENLGFSVGHNQNIRRLPGEAKYILCLNQDAILATDFLEQAVNTLEGNPLAGALQPKLYKCHCEESRAWREGRRGNLEQAVNKDNIFDTTGLVIFKNRQVVNRGQGEIDKGQYDKPEEIFGADGAAPVYRKAALEQIAMPLMSLRAEAQSRGVAIPNSVITQSSRLPRRPSSSSGLLAMTNENCEYFDEDFFAYKEDVDLSWRLRLSGWQIIYEPRAIARHGRSVSGDAVGLKNIRRQRQQISRFSRLHSWQNHYYMLLKNELPSLFWRHFPYIFWRQLKVSIYILLFEPWMLKSIHRFFRTVLLMLAKRKIIMAEKTVNVRELQKWFF